MFKFSITLLSGRTFCAVSNFTADQLGGKALLIKQGNDWRLMPANFFTGAFAEDVGGVLVTEYKPA
jgi:hypothetical protein